FGEFQGVRGLSGRWSQPLTLRKEVYAGSPAARMSVDLALPALADATRIGWDSFSSLRPSVRITDVDAIAVWQQRQVIAGIGLGIGGSLLAGLLFEWTRRKRAGAGAARNGDAVATQVAVAQPVIPSAQSP